MKPASMVRRFEAALTSGFLILACILLCSFLTGVIFPVEHFFPGLPGLVYEFIHWAGVAILGIFILALDTRRGNATYGMRSRKIRFESSNEFHPLTPWRTAARVIVGILLLPLLPISFVMMLLDQRRRSLPDRLYETVVVDTRSDKNAESRGFEVIPTAELVSSPPPLPSQSSDDHFPSSGR